MKRAKKIILSMFCVSVLLCMTACARGNRDNVADDNTATGTNATKEAPQDGVLEDVGDAVEDGARDVKDGVEDVIDGRDQNDRHTEKRMEEDGNSTGADTMNGATDQSGQTDTTR